MERPAIKMNARYYDKVKESLGGGYCWPRKQMEEELDE